MQTTEPASTSFATYCPEDNKLRLYVGRVPRADYERLRAEGWTSTPKQSCDFVATWTPERRATALEFGGVILDEDQSPADRAADRAERFSGYRDRRTSDATGHADRYDAQPLAHGYQNPQRAERAAARHDRIADRATDAWDKAEYWQHRTAGVIAHALHVSAPGVRMGRIKVLEAELRRIVKAREEYAATYNQWRECSEMADVEQQNALALKLAYLEHGDYIHPRTGRKSYLYDHGRKEEGRNDDPLSGYELAALWLSKHGKPRTDETPGEWETHYTLRLAYENQMLEAQGGRAAFVEMIPGGWLGSRQIQKVNKSPATGRVVSVLVQDNHPSSTNRWGNPWPDGQPRVLSHIIETERLSADAYRPPTAEELAAFQEKQKAQKAKAKVARAAVAIPLINPTDADAERLQTIWNQAHKPSSWDKEGALTVLRITQAQYTAASGGTYSRLKTEELTGGGFLRDSGGHMNRPQFPAVAKVRTHGRRVVVITDKPQKPFPAAVWFDPRPAVIAKVEANFPLLLEAIHGPGGRWLEDMTLEQRAIFDAARSVRLAYCDSLTQYGLTATGEAMRQRLAAATTPEPVTA